jgi:hypothetical protein
VVDEDMDQYIHDNADDEQSHADFINAYLEAHGADPINLDSFRTLPSSQATGAQQIGRLTAATRRTPTSATACHRPFPTWPSVSTQPFPAATTTSARPTTCKRSRTRPPSTSASSSKAEPACMPRSPNESPTPRHCASC